jgi:hypothetical protein
MKYPEVFSWQYVARALVAIAPGLRAPLTCIKAGGCGIG